MTPDNPFQKRCRQLEDQLDAALRLQTLLLARHPEALFVWQRQQLVLSNQKFADLASSDETGDDVLEEEWLSAESREQLDALPVHGTQELLLSNRHRQRFVAIADSVVLDSGPAHLVRVRLPEVVDADEKKRDNKIRSDKTADHCTTLTDSVTGLPNREALLRRWQIWIDNHRDERRYVVMNISLPDVQLEAISPAVKHTLQNLMLFRASELIREEVPGRILMGRSGSSALALLLDFGPSIPRRKASSIKALLGNLGGLIDDSGSIAIRTMTLSRSSMSAEEAMQRLESAFSVNARVQESERRARTANR